MGWTWYEKIGAGISVLLILLFVVCIVSLARAAKAADPECEDPVEYDPAIHGQYDATQSVTFCTPNKDTEGDPLQDGDLTRCVVTAAGTPFAITSSNRPGQYVDFATPPAMREVARSGELRVHCETAAGPGAPVVALDARFRDPSAPRRPVLLEP